MIVFEPGAVVIVPFPFGDSNGKPRPALVLSEAEHNAGCGQTLLAMITTAGRAGWPSDTPLTDMEAAGLPVPSVVRARLFTLDNRHIARQIGRLSWRDRSAVRGALASLVAV